MKTTDFRLPDGDRNVGTVYRPDSVDAPLPVMIVCHGWGGDRTLDPFRQALCDRLTKRGVAVVTFDFYGCGETGGSYGDMTYGRWTDNVEAVFVWVASRPWADPQRVGCLGISSGSTAVLRFARQHPGAAFVVSVATCLGLYISMPNTPARTFVRDAEQLLAGERAGVFGVPFPIDFFRDFVEHAPIYDVEKIKCPVLFLQGTEDNPFRRSDAWLGNEIRRSRNVPVHYVEVVDGDHGLNTRPEESVAHAISWLESIGVLY